jgi:hypothetical protein
MAAKVQCPSGHKNPAGQKYCGECGASLAGVCPVGHPNPLSNKFCGECGSRLHFAGTKRRESKSQETEKRPQNRRLPPRADGMTDSTPELSLSRIEELKAKGHSQSEIARMFGVTRQAISWHKHTYNGSLTPREEALKHFPWEVSVPYTQASPYRYMRDHAEYWATGGKGMSDVKLGRLRALYRKIHAGLVVEFDPNIPPEPGVASTGGFAWRQRQPEDGDLLFRANAYATVTDECREIFRLPVVEP